MEKSKFKGIHQILINGKNLYWQMKLKVNGRNCSKCFNTEREAAKAYDLKLIELGRSPVNVLIKKATA